MDSMEALLSEPSSERDTARLGQLVYTAGLLLRIDPERSLQYSKEALRLSIMLGDDRYIGRIYSHTGTANRIQGEYLKALNFHEKALEHARKKSDPKAEADALKNIGNVYLVQGQYTSAAENYGRSLRIHRQQSDTKGVATLLNNLGMAYRSSGKPDTARLRFEEALTIFRSLQDVTGAANALNNLGIIERNVGDREKATELFLDALDLFRKLGDRQGEANTLNNIGNVYFQQKRFDGALEFYEQSLELSRELGDQRSVAGKLSNLGGVHLSMGNGEKALAMTTEALSIQQELGDANGRVSALNNLGSLHVHMGDTATGMARYREAEKIIRSSENALHAPETYASIGELLIAEGEPEAALEYMDKALRKARTHGSTAMLINVYQRLSETYAALEDFEASYRMQRYAGSLRDSLEQGMSKRQLAEMQARFETEQKQRQIELLNKEKEVQELRINKQITVRNMVIAISMLTLILLLLIYARYRTKQRANKLLDRKNHEIEEQRKAVEEKNVQITSSIEYAKRIQDTIMPSVEELHDKLPESFVYYRPKDIVSGDFYWLAEEDGQVFIAAVDCTGHGVPGAFLSMIGNDLLNRIVKVEKLRNPESVLNRLHHDIQVTLKQKHGVTDNHDGMDIALCVFSSDRRKLRFASANRYLYHFRNGELTVTKGDHFNIGGIMHEDVREYTLHEFTLEPGDTCYMFSDGITDQFGGPQERKFGYRNLKSTLLDMQDRPMAEQRPEFEERMKEWMGNLGQIDDHLLIGIRV